MGLLERNKLDTKLRETALRTVLVYKDLAKSLNRDPLKLRRLSSKGVPFTGKELAKKLGKKPKELGDWDSVWWVDADPNTGQVTKYVKISDDFGKWSKALNKQLKKWGAKSELAQLRKKRWVTAGVIAAVVVAAVVVTVLTVGAGAPAAAAAGTGAAGTGAAGTGAAAAGTGAAAAGTGAAGTGAAAGGGLLAKAGKGVLKAGKTVGDKGKDVFNAFNKIAPSLEQDAPLEETSNLAMSSLSPENQQLLQQTTLTDTAGGETKTPAWVLPVVALGGAGVLGTIIYFAVKK